MTPDTPPKLRAPIILRRLRKAHPEAACALHFETPLQLLVATILSAQCTDERVNLVTPDLFRRFPDAAALADADPEVIESVVRPTGFFRQKTKHIQAAARRIVDAYDGAVPKRMDDLLTLQGVARKTANVVLGVAYGLQEGIVVDTHVRRVSMRLGLTDQSDPPKIERDLMALVPRRAWTETGHLFIFHGRKVCTARKPDCPGCPLNDLCPFTHRL